MKLSISSLLLLLLVFLTACQPATEEEGFGAADKAELVRLTLDRALVDQEIPDFELLADNSDELVISSENIEGVDLPAVAGFKLVLLSPDEIQARANAAGDFVYLSFNQFEVETDNLVRIGLGSSFAIAEDSEMIYLIGGGFKIEYERGSDGWAGDIIESWIS